MPVARFQMPDGRIGRFEVPEGTTPEQAQSMISRFVQAGGNKARLATSNEPPPFEKEASETAGVTPAELASANPMARVAVGAASPILGAMEMFGLRSPEARRQLAEMQERGNKALGFGAAGTTADISGNVLSPAWMGLNKAMPVATSLGQRVAQGAELGALSGVTTPGDDPLSQAAGGAVLGTAIPLALGAGGKVASIIQSISPQRRKEAFYAAAAGDKADEIITLLRENKQIVPGSAPTAGQAAAPAGRAEFSAIQSAAAKGLPSKYNVRTDDQSAAQLAKLREVGRDTTAIEAAEASRKAASDPLYTAARKAGDIDVTSITDDINDMLRANVGNRELVSELMNLKKGLKTKTGLKDAEQVASVVDGLKTTMADEKNKFILGKLDAIKTRLEKAIPGYEKAQKVHAEKSIPINQMQTGQYLEGVATPTGYQRGAGTPLREQQFLEAIRKSTDVAGDAAAQRAADMFAKRVTGNPRFRELTEVLDPKQMEAVSDVAADFLRNRQYIEQALKGTPAMPSVAAKLKLPNLLMREAMVMNAIIGKAEAKINEKLAAEIAVEMLNPPAVAEALSRGAARNTSNANKSEFLYHWYKKAFPGGYQSALQEAQ